MKLDISFPSLDAALRAVGGVEQHWNVGGALAALDNALLKGIEVALKDVVPAASGVLTYRDTGRPVVLYIKSPRIGEGSLLENPTKRPRFHVAECATLQDMRQKQRFERYVVTDNRSGLFKVFPCDPITRRDLYEIEIPLLVCRHCLKLLNHESYNSAGPAKQTKIVENFDVGDHLTRHHPLFHTLPTHTAASAPRQGYGPDWQATSNTYRNHVNWCCEDCGVVLTEHKRLLHCHHRNGNTSDNAWSNLKALCLLCHSAQPQHGWMGVKDEDAKLIRTLREMAAF
jgi:hypothetical protein